MKSFFQKNTLLSFIILLGSINLNFGAKYHFSEPNPRWKSILFFSDGEFYYSYLPAVFIYGNFVDIALGGDFGKIEKEGDYFTKYTYGIAALEAPFFFVAHSYTKLFDKDNANGYSKPYLAAIFLAATFYGCIALFLIGKMLQKQFGKNVSILTILILYLGTNLMYYMMKEPGVSHIYSFFVFSLFIYSLQSYLKKENTLYAIITALALGLIVLIRPTNIIMVLLILFWGTNSFIEVKQRITFLFKKPLFITSLTLIPIILYIPQAMYWLKYTGSILSYSYGDEGFSNWNNPHFFSVLFNVQNGWLIYSPIMIFSIWGLILMIRHKKSNAWLITTIVILATYIFSSWWAWWFGGAYGHRCYVEFLALLAFPLAYFIQYFLSHTLFFKIVISIAALLFCYYNCCMTYWYNYTAPWDGPQWNWQKWFDIVSYFTPL